VSVEAGLMDMLDRMQTGKFKVYTAAHGRIMDGHVTAELEKDMDSDYIRVEVSQCPTNRIRKPK
jgi:hypothetical protein